MKSPKDDFIFENPKSGEAAMRKNLPFTSARRLNNLLR
jgi:hypothetical protein